MHDAPKRSLLLMIRAYRYFLSPFFGGHCRFHPTCSAYALEAVERYGAMRGGWLAIRRIARCHPLNDGGVDFVPVEIADRREHRVERGRP